jgi:hypothetical protein
MLYNKAARPACEATREAVVGEVVDKRGRRGGAVLVAPRLALLAADTLYEGYKSTEQEAVFRVQGQSAAIIQAWRVGNCILAEL